MFGVADQELPFWIDDEVEDLEWNDANQRRTIVGQLRNLHGAITPLNRKSDRAVHSKCRHTARDPRGRFGVA